MRTTVLSSILVAAFIVPVVVQAQASAPADSLGATTKQFPSIELGAEFEGGVGRQLRARLVTIAPGGHTAMHTHDGRPTLEYVLQGDVIEIRNGVEMSHVAGDMIVGSKGVSHWWENRSNSPVVLLPVDVFRP